MNLRIIRRLSVLSVLASTSALAFLGSPEGLREYLDDGGDPNRSDGSTTILGEAAQRGSVAEVQMLLSAGADPNGSGGLTPMALAMFGGHVQAVQMLRAAGADPLRASDNGQCALAFAAQAGAFGAQVVREELAKHPAAAPQTCLGWAMRYAIELNQPVVVSALLEGGFPLNQLHSAGHGGDKWLPSFLAMTYNRGAILEIMEKHGAQLARSNVAMNDGQLLPFLHYAAAYKHNDALRVLMEIYKARYKSADVGIRWKSPGLSGNKVTALQFAVAHGNVEGQQMLERAGSKLSKTDEQRMGAATAAVKETEKRAAERQRAELARQHAETAAQIRQLEAHNLQQQAEQDAEDRAYRERVQRDLANAGKTFATEMEKGQQERAEQQRALEQAQERGRREHAAKQQSQQRAADAQYQRELANAQAATRRQEEQAEAYRAAEQRKSAERATAAQRQASAQQAPSPSGASSAGNASNRVDPDACVTRPVLGTNQGCSGDKQANAAAYVTNGCGESVETRICLRVNGAWDCGLRSVAAGASTSYGSCLGRIDDTFVSSRYPDSKKVLGRP